jgi:hypothetical protein
MTSGGGQWPISLVLGELQEFYQRVDCSATDGR